MSWPFGSIRTITFPDCRRSWAPGFCTIESEWPAVTVIVEMSEVVVYPRRHDVVGNEDGDSYVGVAIFVFTIGLELMLRLLKLASHSSFRELVYGPDI